MNKSREEQIQELEFTKLTDCRCLDMGMGVSMGPAICGSCEEVDKEISELENQEEIK